MTDPNELVELRGKSPRAVVDVMDAFALAYRVDRVEVMNMVLGKWARQQMHASNVLQKVTQGNPPLPDSGWIALG